MLLQTVEVTREEKWREYGEQVRLSSCICQLKSANCMWLEKVRKIAPLGNLEESFTGKWLIVERSEIW